ncbi:MAG TPA: 50S ribosomal protein L32 [Candidatus Sulfotelmatobacter sp.]|jgi:large subunit ribosomal protein L32|nr:50S ribosomal protein L32 [Candidatus Sulfotelmatobacter sp.]
MSQEPKKRHSRARQGKRRASIKLTITGTVVCPNCSAPQITHRVCESCGYYKGKQIIKVKQANVSQT